MADLATADDTDALTDAGTDAADCEVLFRAKLQREDSQTAWGFRLQGGVEYNKPLTLLKVVPESVAARSGLHAGDILVKLAGCLAEGMTHKEAQQAIMSSGNALEIIVERADVTMSPPQSHAPSSSPPPPDVSTKMTGTGTHQVSPANLKGALEQQAPGASTELTHNSTRGQETQSDNAPLVNHVPSGTILSTSTTPLTSTMGATKPLDRRKDGATDTATASSTAHHPAPAQNHSSNHHPLQVPATATCDPNIPSDSVTFSATVTTPSTTHPPHSAHQNSHDASSPEDTTSETSTNCIDATFCDPTEVSKSPLGSQQLSQHEEVSNTPHAPQQLSGHKEVSNTPHSPQQLSGHKEVSNTPHGPQQLSGHTEATVVAAPSMQIVAPEPSSQTLATVSSSPKLGPKVSHSSPKLGQRQQTNSPNIGQKDNVPSANLSPNMIKKDMNLSPKLQRREGSMGSGDLRCEHSPSSTDSEGSSDSSTVSVVTVNQSSGEVARSTAPWRQKRSSLTEAASSGDSSSKQAQAVKVVLEQTAIENIVLQGEKDANQNIVTPIKVEIEATAPVESVFTVKYDTNQSSSVARDENSSPSSSAPWRSQGAKVQITSSTEDLSDESVVPKDIPVSEKEPGKNSSNSSASSANSLPGNSSNTPSSIKNDKSNSKPTNVQTSPTAPWRKPRGEQAKESTENTTKSTPKNTNNNNNNNNTKKKKVPTATLR